MKIANRVAWDDYVEKNKNDPYGARCVSYAQDWADLMEAKLATGSKLGAIAKEAGDEADTDEITGFMYGCAVKMLARCWEHGEQLRVWHNNERTNTVHILRKTAVELSEARRVGWVVDGCTLIEQHDREHDGRSGNQFTYFAHAGRCYQLQREFYDNEDLAQGRQVECREVERIKLEGWEWELVAKPCPPPNSKEG